MATPGTPITRRRRGRPVEYVVGSGRPWRTTLSFDADNAEFIVELIREVHPDLSAATVVNTVMALLRRTEGPEGEPLTPASVKAALTAIAENWPAPGEDEAGPQDPQEELPLTG